MQYSSMDCMNVRVYVWWRLMMKLIPNTNKIRIELHIDMFAYPTIGGIFHKNYAHTKSVRVWMLPKWWCERKLFIDLEQQHPNMVKNMKLIKLLNK